MTSNKLPSRLFVVLFMAIFLFAGGPSWGFAQEGEKAQQEETKEKLAEKQEAIEVVAEAAEKVQEEKAVMAAATKLKEQEAALVQREAEILKEQARGTKDAGLKKKAKEAAREAERLLAEAKASKELLVVTEAKARLAQQRMAQDQKEIEALKKELYEMKIESAGLGYVTKWMNHPLFYIGASPVTLGGMGSAFLIVMLGLVFSSLIQKIIALKLAKTSRIRSGAVYAIGRIVHYLILLLAVILAVQCVGLNLGSLAVVFGFLSVGIGFGLQNITSNFISGIILLLERPISVGDLVTVDDKLGTVREISMRSSLIETLDNVRIIVPNSKFIEGNVINWSHGSTRVRIHCPVGVAYGSDIAKVKEALMKVAASHEHVLEEPAPAARFTGFGDSALDFDLLLWVDAPEMQYTIHSDINYAIDAAFREAGISIPFPQRDLHIRSSEVDFSAR